MFLFELLNLRRGFSQYFRYVPALTPELAKEVYRIRHKVYCEDLKFEPQRADGMETDEYDAHSLYGLVQSAASGEYVGCARLILPCPANEKKLFPVEKSCAQTIDRSILDPRQLPRQKVGEVSRLAIISAFRRRKGEENRPAPIDEDSFGTEKQPRFPYIPFALYFGCAALARKKGIDHVLVLTEPRLSAHFRKLGMDIRQIGLGIEHRGHRVPSVINAKTFPKDIHFALRSLYALIEEEVERSFDVLPRSTATS
jgi:N-acyl amino acid synthase of PEP-CTERM/exosortase system